MHRKTLSAALALVLLAGCQDGNQPAAISAPPAPQAAAAEPAPATEADQPEPSSAAPYQARGNEPGWHAILDGDTFQLTARYGELQLRSTATKILETEAGGRAHVPAIDGHNVTLTIVPGVCRDSMTGMPHPDHATLELDGESLPGCGGDPRSLLIGSTWHIQSIGSDATLPNIAIDITFDDSGRIHGAGSCNRYTGSYTLTAESLQFGQIASTMMACPELQMTQEQRLHQTLATIHRFDIGSDGELLLLANEEPVIRALR